MKPSKHAQTWVDPVCRMRVDEETPVPSYRFRSDTYRFCAETCRQAFMADPEKYLTSRPRKRKGFWGRYLERINKATGGKPPCCH